MIFTETKLKGCFTIEPKIIRDERGYFMESFNQKTFLNGIGQNVHFVQDNQSFSSKGVLRGLHYQCGEHAQAKLVRVLQGEVLDIAVDIRPGSPTYGRYEVVDLSGVAGNAVLIGAGLGHGFVSLADASTVAYLISSPFSPTEEFEINPLDPAIGIEWGLPVGQLLFSPKDKAAPTLDERKAEGRLP